jgi:hypothetical protein
MISIKDVIDLGQRAFSAINGKRDTDERKRFEAGRQLFLMEMITNARNARGNAIRPTPGTLCFDYSEALAREGLLERDLIAGVYWIKSGF